jgi:DNA-binding GntR family transcriptional regulator
MELSAGPTPLYFQLQQLLRERIMSGELPPGATLPTEAQLCTDFGVSRITVGKALDALAAERLILRKRGVGTFVAERPVPAKSVRLTGTLEDMLAPVKNPSRRLIETRLQQPSPVVAKMLGSDERVYCFDALHFSGEGVFSHSEMFVPRSIGERLAGLATEFQPPSIHMVEALMGVQVARADQSIEPVVGNAKTAKLLKIEKGRPMLEIMRTYYTSKNKALAVVSAWYHPDRFRYSIELFPRSTRS